MGSYNTAIHLTPYNKRIILGFGPIFFRIRDIYPSLTFTKFEVLKFTGCITSQYEENKKLQVNFHSSFYKLAIKERPLLIIVALDEFELLHLRQFEQSDDKIQSLLVKHREMVTLSSHCLYAFGNNRLPAEFKLLAYLASNKNTLEKVNYYFSDKVQSPQFRILPKLSECRKKCLIVVCLLIIKLLLMLYHLMF